MSMGQCPLCSGKYEPTTTTFTLTKPTAVYVVKDVPAVECQHCGHIAFEQDVAKRLERFTSGRIGSARQLLTAWVYQFEDPGYEIPKAAELARTENIILLPPASSPRPELLSITG